MLWKPLWDSKEQKENVSKPHCHPFSICVLLSTVNRENIQNLEPGCLASLRIRWTWCGLQGACLSLSIFLWWSTKEWNPVSFGLLVYTQELRPDSSKQGNVLIVLRSDTTLLKPSLHSAHQTLQKLVRFHGASMAEDWGQLRCLPGSPFSCDKWHVTQGKPSLMPFPQSGWEMGTRHILLHHSAMKLVRGFE